jgi:hypothetical protein
VRKAQQHALLHEHTEPAQSESTRAALSTAERGVAMGRLKREYLWYRFQSYLRRGIIRGDVTMVSPALAEKTTVVREVMRGNRNEECKWHRR